MMPQQINTLFSRVQQLSESIKKCFSGIRHHLTPYHCYFCDGTTTTGSWVCSGCYADLPWNNNHCMLCALPMPSSLPNLICRECQCYPPSFELAICAFRYELPIDMAIQLIKYHRKRYFVAEMTQMLADYIETRYVQKDYPDLLVAVPIHRDRQKQRGFNQSQLMANKLSSIFNIPADQKLLRKLKATKSQAGLKKPQRIHNLEGSFSIQKSVKDQHIAIIDDVMTTMATAELLSKMLLKAGAKQVDIWCPARTEKQH